MSLTKIHSALVFAACLSRQSAILLTTNCFARYITSAVVTDFTDLFCLLIYIQQAVSSLFVILKYSIHAYVVVLVSWVSLLRY